MAGIHAFRLQLQILLEPRLPNQDRIFGGRKLKSLELSLYLTASVLALSLYSCNREAHQACCEAVRGSAVQSVGAYLHNSENISQCIDYKGKSVCCGEECLR